MFKINDYIETNGVAGEVFKGTIVGIYDGKFYRESYPFITFENWDAKCPDWHKENVFIVRLDKPAKQCSLEEAFKSGKTLEWYNDLPLLDKMTCARFMMNRVY